MPWITSKSGDGKIIVEAHIELQFSGSSVTVQQLRHKMYELKTAIAKGFHHKGFHHVNPDGVEITDIREIKSSRRLLNVNNHHHFNENKNLFKLTRHLVAGSKIFISTTKHHVWAKIKSSLIFPVIIRVSSMRVRMYSNKTLPCMCWGYKARKPFHMTMCHFTRK